MLDMKIKAICACYCLFIIVAILSQLEISWHKFTSIQTDFEIVPKYFLYLRNCCQNPHGKPVK